jgi:2-(1,2-epoxy-1,2-dihydrophenyl)acetyl-CoA isomerase
MSIQIEHEDAMAIVTIDRPERKNAFTAEMLGTLIESVAQLGADPEVRALVLTGAGGEFSSGADVEGLKEGYHDGAEKAGLAAFDPELWLVNCPKPVVAAVDGVAVGMGVELTVQADIRIATPRARFAWVFSRLGLVPDTGAAHWLLPRIVGLPKALELLYSGEFLGGEDALACGYVSQLVEPEELRPAAVDLARRLAAGKPGATAAIKALTYGGLSRDQAENQTASEAALAERFASAEFREAVAAFLARD